MIDFDALISRYIKKEFRVKVIGKYYPSEAGQCLRKAYYSFINPKELDGELTKVFEAGNMVHEFVAKVFASEKTPEVELLESETPFEISVDDFVISGRIDNLILLKAENKQAVVEVKSTKMLSMMETPQESHVMQLQLYLHARQITDGLILYIEKNTLKSKVFPLVYDPAYYEKSIARFRKLHHHLKSSTVPEPESRLSAEKKWMCKSCEYRDECFQATPTIGLQEFI